MRLDLGRLKLNLNSYFSATLVLRLSGRAVKFQMEMKTMLLVHPFSKKMEEQVYGAKELKEASEHLLHHLS